MLDARAIAFALAVSLAAGGLGCAQSGGGSSGGTSGGSSAATGGGGGAFTGTDTTPPTYTIGFPGRGEFVSGAAQVTISGTASDTESGVARVQVNGQAATLSGSDWTFPATLDFGTNIFTLSVTDNQGNVAHTSWSAIYSPTFLAANQMVDDAAAIRLSANAINQIVPAVVNTLTSSGVLQNAITAAIGGIGSGIQINTLTFGNPQVAVTLVQNGFRTVIDIPNVVVDASWLGIPFYYSQSNVQIDATLLVTVSNGTFATSMPAPPSIQPSIPLVGGMVATALQVTLPPVLTNALNDAMQPRTFVVGATTITLETRPRTLAIDPQNARVSGDANLSMTPSPNAPAAPGSASRNGSLSAAPTFSTPHDISLALREDMVNRMAFAAWQAGLGQIRIDQAFFTNLGINLPIPLDASLLVPFFPVLGTLNPTGGPIPLAFEVKPLLPPVIEVTGTPSLVTTELGELHLSILMDFGGQGYTDVLTLAVHSEMGASIDIANNQVQITPGLPSRIAVDLLANPFGLSMPDVNAFLQTGVPMLVGLAGSLVPAIPLPPLPAGLQIQNVDIRQDGAGADFLTIEGDL